MKPSEQIITILRPFRLLPSLLIGLAWFHLAYTQQPADEERPRPRFPMQIDPDPRVEQRSYRFGETGEEMKYVLFVSSKVSRDKKHPVIIALHGLGGDGNFIVRNRLVDLAEEGGYIVAGPLGYNVSGWYGSPVLVFGGRPVEPPNLAELSEQDVLNVLAMTREAYNVDAERIYLLGHSMGGAGALFLGGKHSRNWAAIAAIAPAAFLMLEKRADYLTQIRDAGLPVMVVQGGKDPAVPAEYTRRWIDTMKELGVEHEYVEFPEGDHGNVIGDGMPDIFRFFAEHTKAGRAE
jgi:predicted esterase